MAEGDCIGFVAARDAVARSGVGGDDDDAERVLAACVMAYESNAYHYRCYESDDA